MAKQFSGRKRSVGKGNVCTHVSVILFTVATEPAGMQPTGMHTCYSAVFSFVEMHDVTDFLPLRKDGYVRPVSTLMECILV